MTGKLFKWTIAAVILIAIGSFALSYSALVELAAANGVKHNLAYVWPLIVDVSVIVFTAGILVAQLQKRGAKLPIALTGFYAIVTITGNILHAPATPLGWFVAALPPLSLIFATEMLRGMAHHNILHNTAAATLQDLTQQATGKAQELARVETQLQNTLAQIEQAKLQQAEIMQAKSENAPVFADVMQAGKQNSIAERREIVLQLAQAGQSEKEIAEQLSKDVRTIKKDLQALNGKVKS